MSIVEMDKCNETFSIRIPDILKFNLDKLSKRQRMILNETLITDMARAVHDSKFEPELYIKSD